MNTNIEYDKTKRKNILAIVFMAIVFVGALLIGISMFIAEFSYPHIEELFGFPIWYQIFLYGALALAIGGIIGCFFTKNKNNTSKFELYIELVLLIGGLFLEIVLALVRSESTIKAVLICCCGLASSIGMFCGIATLIGRYRKPKE